MVCDASGDIINYIESIEKISNIEACKKALILENIYFEDIEKKDLSEEEKEDIAKNKKRQEKKIKSKKEEKRKKKKQNN